MTEREALLRAVCERPDDDLPRLVFADWLDENGDPARAEFIRTQIELARGAVGDRRAAIEARERDLLAEHRERWDEPFRALNTDPSGYEFVQSVHYRRGLVWAVEIVDDGDQFADVAADLFRLGPIRRLQFWQKHSHERSSACPELLRLTELRTDRAGFEADELRHLFASPHLRNLVRLDLIADDDNAHLDRSGIELLAHSTALPGLRHLDLSGNWCEWHYTNEDWTRSLTGGPLVAQLDHLALRDTFLTGAAVANLVRTPTVAKLRHLDLGGNWIGPDGFLALAESPHLAALKVLDLRGCQDDGVAEGDEDRVPQDLIDRLKARFGDRVLLDGEPDRE